MDGRSEAPAVDSVGVDAGKQARNATSMLSFLWSSTVSANANSLRGLKSLIGDPKLLIPRTDSKDGLRRAIWHSAPVSRLSRCCSNIGA